MTNEEAIEIINRENDPNDKKVWELFPEYREALNMAIKALSQEPCTDAIEQLKKYTHNKKNTDKVEISVLVLNRIIKALSQEPCDDAISREKALFILEDMRGLCREDVLKDAIKQMNELPPVTQKSGKIPDNATNSELFKQIFGIYATELWTKSESEFLEWINERYQKG